MSRQESRSSAAPKNSLSLFLLFPHLFAMKWWDQMQWSLFFELNFKPAFSFSSFTLIKRLFSFSLLSAIRVVSSAYLRLLIFLLEILISAYDSFSSHFTWCTLNVHHWKDWCWSWNSNILATWCEELMHWKRPWCWENWRQERKGKTEDEMVGWHHWLDGHEFEQALRVDDGQESQLCYSPWACRVSYNWATELILQVS